MTPDDSRQGGGAARNGMPDPEICAFLGARDGEAWQARLAHAGLVVRCLTAVELADLPEAGRPCLLLCDIDGDLARLDLLKAVLARRRERRIGVVALAPDDDRPDGPCRSTIAHDLGALDMLCLREPAGEVARRLRGAIAAMTPAPPASGSISDYIAVCRHLTRMTDGLAPGEGTVVMLIELDRFHHYLSRFGRAGSLALLRETGARIERLAREVAAQAGTDVHVANLPADEFAVLLAGRAGRPFADTLAKRLLGEISAPFGIDGQTVYPGANIGVAIGPDDATDPELLLRCAHVAMSHAKARRGHAVVFHTAQLAAGLSRRLETEHRLRHALSADELQLYYQPQASVETRRIVGIEALLRWNHPELGLVSPESFIGIAEEAGLTAELGRWAISTALTEIAALERRGLPPLQLSVNLSPDMLDRFDGRELAELTRDLLAEAGRPAERFTFEITERSLLDDEGAALIAVEALSALGIRIALDDFGTGYSALSRLRGLPVDEIKIDRRFIAGDLDEDMAILGAILAMAHKMGTGVVAEGVETDEQLARLAAIGCDLFQGYLCSPALPGERLLDLVGIKSS